VMRAWAGHRLRRFWRDETGSGTVELLVSVMVLNMLLMAFFLWWGTYNSHALVDRMTYTINDLATRQRGTVLQREFLDGLERTAEFILDPEQDAAIRFTQVTMRAGETELDPPRIEVEWSYSPCGALPAAVAGTGFDVGSLPMMAVGATMIVTDVQVPYVSTFDLIPSLVFDRRAVSLYRFETRFDLEGGGTATCID
jgi:Flp pilus assembly protein TadG